LSGEAELQNYQIFQINGMEGMFRTEDCKGLKRSEGKAGEVWMGLRRLTGLEKPTNLLGQLFRDELEDFFLEFSGGKFAAESGGEAMSATSEFLADFLDVDMTAGTEAAAGEAVR